MATDSVLEADGFLYDESSASAGSIPNALFYDSRRNPGGAVSGTFVKP